MKEHTGTIRVVKFLSEGSGGAALLASAGAGDCKPRLWDAQAGEIFVQSPFNCDSAYLIVSCEI